MNESNFYSRTSPYNTKFRTIYKFIKENILIDDSQKNAFIESTQIFSIPIFYQILLLITILKTILCIIYFMVMNRIYFNINISLIFIQLSTSFLLTQQQEIIKIKIKSFKKILIHDTFLEQILKGFYICTFCLEENMTIYTYDLFLFQLNPSFIYFVILLILFFDLKTTKSFNEFLFYLYILNLVLLIYFFSMKNLMNFFLPINLVLAMFILLNVISQNFNKKLIKIHMYHKFFEQLISEIFKFHENDMYVVCDKKIIYKEQDNRENLLTEENQYASSTERSELVSEYSNIETKMNYFDLQIIPVEGFKNFELILPDFKKLYNSNFSFFNKNFISSFINLLFYLKNFNSPDSTVDKTFLSELENIYSKYFNNLKNKFLKNVNTIQISNFSIREKIITLMISFIIEASNDNYKINCDEFLEDSRIINNKLQITFKTNFLEKKEIKSLITIIDDLSKCLNYECTLEENSGKLLINFKKEFQLNQVRLNLKVLNLTEEEISLDDFKLSTPKNFIKKNIHVDFI